RNSSASPSVVIVAPSKRASTRREKCASNGKVAWLHSVIEKAVSSRHSLRLEQRWTDRVPLEVGWQAKPLNCSEFTADSVRKNARIWSRVVSRARAADWRKKT